ncbi:Cytidylate kinase [Chlamydiales bacterium SCGC AG-110-P3]|nr:Cytidylate kinase [Chlamydiales bacterium SCGC AG-110-P3]
MIVTIDGPSGTGKSTIAKKVAKILHFTCIDTGAMYRSVTYGVLNAGIPINAEETISQYLDTFDLRVQKDDSRVRYFLDGEEITSAIRSDMVTQKVSAVSALATVRQHLVAIQRRLAEGQNVVLEGRDIGTVVFPQAEVKVFLTARPEIRAKRRLSETHSNDWDNADLQRVQQDINRRDKYDSERDHSPLRPAEDAVLIDTSDLDINEVVDAVLTLVRSK